MRAKRIVSERRLYQPLTVVECAAHRDGADVSTQRRHLCFLHVTDLAFRIEHDDARVRDAEECLCHRTSGIARRGHQNGERGPVGEVVQQPRLDAGADVLERQGGAVEQLERPDAIGHLTQRHIEVQRVPDERREIGAGDLVAEEMGSHGRRHLHQPAVTQPLQRRSR